MEVTELENADRNLNLGLSNLALPLPRPIKRISQWPGPPKKEAKYFPGHHSELKGKKMGQACFLSLSKQAGLVPGYVDIYTNTVTLNIKQTFSLKKNCLVMFGVDTHLIADLTPPSESP